MNAAMNDGVAALLGFPPVKFGFGAIRELPALCKGFGISRPLIITDKGLVTHGVLKKLLDALPHGFAFALFDDIPPNPTVGGILRAAEVYKAESCNGIVALGGGSVLDSGKALRVAVSHPGPFIHYLGPNANIGADLPPCITIPTTAGTGAEITPAAGIHPDETTRSAGVRSPHITPNVAICDPELTMSLPRFLTAATGLDALSHCIEAYLSINTDPILDAIALDGIRRVADYLPRVTADRSDREARWHMLLAGLQGGMAIYKGLGPVHAMAGTLGDEGLHHGLLCSIAAPAVLRFYRGKMDARLSQIAQALGAPVGTPADRAVEGLIAKLGVPTNLQEAGYKNRNLDEMAQDAAASHFNMAATHRPGKTDYRALFEALSN